MNPNNDQKMYLILVLFLAAVALGLAQFQFRFLSKPTLITVTGEGKFKKQPSMVKFTVMTINTAPSANQVIGDNNSLIKNLTEILKKNGVAESDMVQAYPVVVPPQAALGQTNYQAANGIEVTLKNIGGFEGLVFQLYNAGARSITNITFTTEDATDIEKETISLAITNAQKRAQELAKASGKRLGRMVSIATSETGSAGSAVGEAPKTTGITGSAASSIPSLIEVTRYASIVFELK